MKCNYYLNNKKSQLYTDLYGYMDEIAGDKKSADEVYKILKNHGIATRYNSKMFITQAGDSTKQLREVDRINARHPGLLTTSFKGKGKKVGWEPAGKVYTLEINEGVLKNIYANKEAAADYYFETEAEIDEHFIVEATTKGAFETDEVLSEQALKDNASQSRESQMEVEAQKETDKKVTHLKNIFAKAGVEVDVIFDTELDALGQVDAAEEGKPVTIRLNPDALKADTAYHEFGHIYIDMLGVSDPAVQAAIEELRGTELYTEVQAAYPELTGEALDKEVLVTAIGKEGAKMTRKDPSKLQVLLNKLFRAFSTMLSKAGLKVSPNGAAAIAAEMISGNLRVADMSNQVSRYAQKSKDVNKLDALVKDVRVKIESDIKDIRKLPEAEQVDKLDRLERLKSILTKVNKVEDFARFVDNAADAAVEARTAFDRIMALPVAERATPENMNKMYEIKKTIDSFDTIYAIKKLLRVKDKDGKILKRDRSAADTMQERLGLVIEDVEMLDESFQDELIPLMADVLLPYHNTELDPQLQELIDNVQKHKRLSFNAKELNRMPEYLALKRRRTAGKLTEEQFKEEALKLNVQLLKNKQMLGREDIIREMRKAHKDKSGFSFWFDPLIYSSDPLIQMFAKSVKQAEFNKNDMTLDFKYDLKSEYDAFAEGQSESDVAALNEALLEDVDVPVFSHDGTKSATNALSLVQPLLVGQYQADQRVMIEALYEKHNRPKQADFETDEEYKDAMKVWGKTPGASRFRIEEEQWYTDNTEPIDGWTDERKALDVKISKTALLLVEARREGRTEAVGQLMLKSDKLLQTKRRNLTANNKFPKGEWVKPRAAKYANPKYAAIQSDPRLKRYYDFVLSEFKKGQAMVGKNRFSKNKWDDFSYIMPSIRKSEFDKAREDGLISSVKDMLKDGFSTQSTDNQWGVYNERSGELKKSVPVYYTGVEDSKTITKDIASSMYGFRHMAHNYKSKSSIVGQVMLFKEYMASRATLKVDSSGVEMINGIADQLGIKMPAKEPGESYNYQHVNEWIDMIMFGQKEFQANFNIGGKDFSANKVAGALNGFMAMNTLAFNALQGANQVILDNMSLVSESMAGEFMSKSDLAWAKAEYWKNGASLSDIGKFAPDTKMGKAVEFFDANTEFTDNEGNKLVGGALRKAMSTDHLMFIQQGAEHELSTTRMLGLMKATAGKLKNAKGEVLMNDAGQPANLYEMLVIDKKGKMSIDPRVVGFNKSDFINLIQGLSRKTNQTKGTFDRAMLNRRWYGKLAMLFRNWMIPGIRRRYGHGGFSGSSIQVDEELGAVTQGMYVSFWNMLTESYSNKALPMTTYRTMTNMEKRNVKRTMVELSSLATAIAMVAALSNLDDDEETWVSNFMLYQAKRYEMEIMQWTPLVGTKEAFRILKSPTATARPVEQGVALIEHMVFQELPYMLGMSSKESEIFYKRKTGRYNKGDRKLRKKVNDLIPVLRGIQKSSSPEDAVKWFNSMK